jgi:hypothetical protein
MNAPMTRTTTNEEACAIIGAESFLKSGVTTG